MLFAPARVPKPVYRLTVTDGKQRFATRSEVELEKLKSQLEDVAFLALCSNEWAAGLAPIFIVEKTNRLELRRRPPRGRENFAEPLFFALPPEDEPGAGQ